MKKTDELIIIHNWFFDDENMSVLFTCPKCGLNIVIELEPEDNTYSIRRVSKHGVLKSSFKCLKDSCGYQRKLRFYNWEGTSE